MNTIKATDGLGDIEITKPIVLSVHRSVRRVCEARDQDIKPFQCRFQLRRNGKLKPLEH